MVVDYELEANEVGFVKIIKTEKPYEFKGESRVAESGAGVRLEITGFTEEGEALFKITNKDENFVQNFGVTLKYFLAHQESVGDWVEGAYLFVPEIKN